ncbi:MAG: class I SAM-dependent methyltransferase [Alphaproteobacteria bacterium]|nr:class I SAM-dependent methyltransferase [Alphaproteobacteria bacterium]
MFGWLLGFFLVLLALFEIFLVLSLVEHIYAVRFRHQYPSVSCRTRHGRTIVDEIKKHYPDAKTAIDIGAGYGRLCRAMTHIPGLHITAIENMPFTVFVLRFLNFIFGARRVKVICTDAFEYIKHSHKKFDLGVAYLGPAMNPRLLELRKNFRVIITLDVPIPGIRATREIDVPGGGHTHYQDLGEFPHRLFVYEFDKR